MEDVFVGLGLFQDIDGILEGFGIGFVERNTAFDRHLSGWVYICLCVDKVYICLCVDKGQVVCGGICTETHGKHT